MDVLELKRLIGRAEAQGVNEIDAIGLDLLESLIKVARAVLLQRAAKEDCQQLYAQLFAEADAVTGESSAASAAAATATAVGEKRSHVVMSTAASAADVSQPSKRSVKAAAPASAPAVMAGATKGKGKSSTTTATTIAASSKKAKQTSTAAVAAETAVLTRRQRMETSPAKPSAHNKSQQAKNSQRGKRIIRDDSSSSGSSSGSSNSSDTSIPFTGEEDSALVTAMNSTKSHAGLFTRIALDWKQRFGIERSGGELNRRGTQLRKYFPYKKPQPQQQQQQLPKSSNKSGVRVTYQWTPEEDQKLLKLRKEYKKESLDFAEQMGFPRDKKYCCRIRHRLNVLLKSKDGDHSATSSASADDDSDDDDDDDDDDNSSDDHCSDDNSSDDNSSDEEEDNGDPGPVVPDAPFSAAEDTALLTAIDSSSSVSGLFVKLATDWKQRFGVARTAQRLKGHAEHLIVKRKKKQQNQQTDSTARSALPPRYEWTAEQDRIILDAYQAVGNKWMDITALLNFPREKFFARRIADRWRCISTSSKGSSTSLKKNADVESKRNDGSSDSDESSGDNEDDASVPFTAAEDEALAVAAIKNFDNASKGSFDQLARSWKTRFGNDRTVRDLRHRVLILRRSNGRDEPQQQQESSSSAHKPQREQDSAPIPNSSSSQKAGKQQQQQQQQQPQQQQQSQQKQQQQVPLQDTSSSGRTWTAAQDKEIIIMIRRIGFKWQNIAVQVGLPIECGGEVCARWIDHLSQRSIAIDEAMKWDIKEKRKLLNAADLFCAPFPAEKSMYRWLAVAMVMKRPHEECQRVLKQLLQDSQQNSEEDRKIVKLLVQNGFKWAGITAQLGKAADTENIERVKMRWKVIKDQFFPTAAPVVPT